jgi:hypothetical protein
MGPGQIDDEGGLTPNFFLRFDLDLMASCRFP